MDPAQTILIGDSTVDVMTAKKRGIRCIARQSKLRTKEELLAEGAVAVFSSLTPIISYLIQERLLPNNIETETKG